MAGDDRQEPRSTSLDDDDIRKTTKVPSRVFQGPAHSLAELRLDSIDPSPIAHEDLASDKLIAEALRQIEAGGRLQTDSDRKDLDEEDLLADPFRIETEPLTAERVAEIIATAPKEARPIVRMAPITKPPFMKAYEASDAVKAAVATVSTTHSDDANPGGAPVADAQSDARTAMPLTAHSVANPRKRMPVLRREDFEDLDQPPTDARFRLLGALFVIAVVATLALLSLR